jgi:dihydroneopterin aldolase
MGRISLEGMHFFGHHGYYDEEQKIGNKYEVDISLDVDLEKAGGNDQLNDTINYEVVYDIVRSHMEKPARLLEHLAHNMAQEVMDRFPSVKSTEVSVSKFNPPIGGVCSRARVQISKSRP